MVEENGAHLKAVVLKASTVGLCSVLVMVVESVALWQNVQKVQGAGRAFVCVTVAVKDVNTKDVEKARKDVLISVKHMVVVNGARGSHLNQL